MKKLSMSPYDSSSRLCVHLRIPSRRREGPAPAGGDMHALHTQVLNQTDDKMLPNLFHGLVFISFFLPLRTDNGTVAH